jgi:hypothetical protein
MIRRIVIASLVAALSFSSMAAGLAQERKTGDRLAYTLSMGGGPKSGSTTSTITLVIDSVAADGSAHAKGTLDAQHVSSIPFEATISAAGEVLTKVEPMGRPSVTSKAQMTAAAASAMTQFVAFGFRPFNALAAACAARGTLHVGDSWSSPTSDAPHVTVTYNVTARANHLGHDAFAVTMASAPGSAIPISGSGYYDPSARLVVGVQSEIADPNSGQTGNIDIALQP